MIVVDIWGGEDSMDWLARFVRPVEEALQIARIEMAKGYLVNLREDDDFSTEDDFDSRHLQ